VDLVHAKTNAGGMAVDRVRLLVFCRKETMTENSAIGTALRQELEKVQRQIAALERSIDFEPDFGLGEGDPTITRREVDRALLERLKIRAESLGRAIAGVGKGTHGICNRCGSTIHPDRLAILPGTRVCARCAQVDQGVRGHALPGR
jgi:RNA polymerase-binding transcription factor DksA